MLKQKPTLRKGTTRFNIQQKIARYEREVELFSKRVDETKNFQTPQQKRAHTLALKAEKRAQFYLGVFRQHLADFDSTSPST